MEAIFSKTYRSTNLSQNFYQITLIVFLLELTMGGNGEIFVIYGLPVRQIIFALIISVYLFDLLNKKIFRSGSEVYLLIYFILTWVLASALIGFFYGHDNSLIWGDVKPMLCFILYRPLSHLVNLSKISFQNVFKIFIVSAFIVSVFSLSIYFVIYFGIFGDRSYVQHLLNEILGEGVIRTRSNGSVSYDGLVYVLIALCMCYSYIINRCAKLFVSLTFILCCSAILFSLTKGVIISAIVSIMVISLLNLKKMMQIKIVLFFSTFLLFLFVLSQSSLNYERLDFHNFTREDSLNVRVKSYYDASETINNSGFFGSGFGQILSLRPSHLENSYLDIFMEQGVIGISLYVLLFVYIFCAFRKAYRNRLLEKHLLDALFGGYVGLLLLTATNPYINNPLGISYLLLLLIFLDCHSRKLNDSTRDQQ